MKLSSSLLFVVPFVVACGSPPSKPANASTNAAPNVATNSQNVATNSQNIATNSQNIATNSQNVATNSQNVMPNNVTTVDMPYAITFDEACDSSDGFTPASIIEGLNGFYEDRLSYIDSGEVTFMALEFFWNEEEIICTPAWEGPPNSGAAYQPPQISIPVTAYFYTEDGQFNEEFVATLTADAFGDEASVGGEILLGDLAGAYSPAELDPLGEDVRILIKATVRPDAASTGSVTVTGTERGQGVARWPAPD